MAKRPAFDFKLGQSPRVREKQEWMEVASDTRALGTASLENARVLTLEHVEPGPWQVRREFHTAKMDELVESVRAQGVLEPILVQAVAGGRYHIIAGERRYRAARAAGLTTIPAIVLELDDLNARVISLMENIQRDDLNEIERAEGLVVLKQITKQTWEEIGQLLGVTKRHVLHMISLTRLPQPVQDLVRAGQLSAKHGRLIAYVKDPAQQIAAASVIADRHLNAQQTAAVVKQLGSEPGFIGTAGEPLTPEAIQDRVAALVDAVAHSDAAAKAAQAAPEQGDHLAGAMHALCLALADFSPAPEDRRAAGQLRADLEALIGAAEGALARLGEQ